MDEARAFYARTMQQVMQGEQPEYIRNLQFETRTASATADPGEEYDFETAQVAASDEAAESSVSMQTATGGDDIQVDEEQ